MISIILIFVWFALSLLLESFIKDDAYISDKKKRALYVVLTLPSVWLVWSKKILSAITPVSLAEKIKEFFLV